MLNPKTQGFSDRIIAADRCQVILLRLLALHYGNRLVLKGGMAMRALFGSLRLTKDVDFERDPSLSNASLENSLPKTLAAAALESGLTGTKANISKHTRTTIRASLHATEPQSKQEIHFEVEISGRGLPPPNHICRLTVNPPSDYFIAPFSINAFDSHAMAAAKVAALHSENRSVPRDIFDLNDLIARQADPCDLLASADPEWLKGLHAKAIDKASLVGWDRANEELFPYLPPAVAQSLSPEHWDELCLKVATQVDAWVENAIRKADENSTQKQSVKKP